MILEHFTGRYLEGLSKAELDFVYKNGHINPHSKISREKQLESNGDFDIGDKIFNKIKADYELTKDSLNIVTVQRCFMDMFDIYKNMKIEDLDNKDLLHTLSNLIVFILHLKREGYKEFVETLDTYFRDKMTEFTNLTSDQLRNSWRVWRYPVVRKRDENRLAENKMKMVSTPLKKVQYELAEAITPAELGDYSTSIERLEKYYAENVNNQQSKIFQSTIYRVSVLLYLLRIADKANEKQIIKKYSSESLKAYSLTHRHFTYFKPVELFIILYKNNMTTKENAIEEMRKFLYETLMTIKTAPEALESNLLVPHLRLNLNNIEFLTELPPTLEMYKNFRFGDYIV